MDEDIVVNPALAVKLSDDFKIEVPTVPDDWDSISLDKFLQEGFGKQIAKQEWEIKRGMLVGPILVP